MLVITVKQRELLLAVRRIVGGVDVEHDSRRLCFARGDKQLREPFVEGANPLNLGLLDFLIDGPLVDRLFVFAPREVVAKPR